MRHLYAVEQVLTAKECADRTRHNALELIQPQRAHTYSCKYLPLLYFFLFYNKNCSQRVSFKDQIWFLVLRVQLLQFQEMGRFLGTIFGDKFCQLDLHTRILRGAIRFSLVNNVISDFYDQFYIFGVCTMQGMFEWNGLHGHFRHMLLQCNTLFFDMTVTELFYKTSFKL